MHLHEILVNRLVNFAQENSVISWTDHLDMTMAIVWDVQPQLDKQAMLPHFEYISGF